MKQEVLNLKEWLSIDEGIEISELLYKAHSWKMRRRIIVVRQSVIVKPKAAGKTLFDLPAYYFYRYQLYVTNLSLSPVEIWKLYRQRADSENRIKELKNDFGINGFCLQKFYATEAAFRMVLITYNLLSLFTQAVLKQKIQPTLSTIRFKCFARGKLDYKKRQEKSTKTFNCSKKKILAGWVI